MNCQVCESLSSNPREICCNQTVFLTSDRGITRTRVGGPGALLSTKADIRDRCAWRRAVAPTLIDWACQISPSIRVSVTYLRICAGCTLNCAPLIPGVTVIIRTVQGHSRSGPLNLPPYCYVARGDIWYLETSSNRFSGKAETERRNSSENLHAVYLRRKTLHCQFL